MMRRFVYLPTRDIITSVLFFASAVMMPELFI